MNKLVSLFGDYQKSVTRLDEALREERSAIVRDSAIKRFELAFDLSWKLIKEFLQVEKGLQCRSPKDCLRSAFQQGILEYDDYWIELTDLRNESVHVYKEVLADEIYTQLPQALKKFKELETKISSADGSGSLTIN